MGFENNIKVASVNYDQYGKARTVDDSTAIEKQTRVRRLFAEPQLFAFSASYFTTWLGVGSFMYYAFLNGGPVAYLFNYVIVLIGVMAQAASLGELASIHPVAGAQYYWIHVSKLVSRPVTFRSADKDMRGLGLPSGGDF